VQLDHAALALRLAAGQVGLDLRDGRRVDAVEQPLGLRPRLLAAVARDDVQADAVAQPAAVGVGQAVDPGELLGDGGRRLAPGEVGVDVPGGDSTGGR
jgi:hypothetical protein